MTTTASPAKTGRILRDAGKVFPLAATLLVFGVVLCYLGTDILQNWFYDCYRYINLICASLYGACVFLYAQENRTWKTLSTSVFILTALLELYAYSALTETPDVVDGEPFDTLPTVIMMVLGRMLLFTVIFLTSSIELTSRNRRSKTTPADRERGRWVLTVIAASLSLPLFTVLADRSLFADTKQLVSLGMSAALIAICAVVCDWHATYPSEQLRHNAISVIWCIVGMLVAFGATGAFVVSYEQTQAYQRFEFILPYVMIGLAFLSLLFRLRGGVGVLVYAVTLLLFSIASACIQEYVDLNILLITLGSIAIPIMTWIVLSGSWNEGVTVRYAQVKQDTSAEEDFMANRYRGAASPEQGRGQSPPFARDDYEDSRTRMYNGPEETARQVPYHAAAQFSGRVREEEPEPSVFTYGKPMGGFAAPQFFDRVIDPSKRIWLDPFHTVTYASSSQSSNSSYASYSAYGQSYRPEQRQEAPRRAPEPPQPPPAPAQTRSTATNAYTQPPHASPRPVEAELIASEDPEYVDIYPASVCPNCGNPITQGARFCMMCGIRREPVKILKSQLRGQEGSEYAKTNGSVPPSRKQKVWLESENCGTMHRNISQATSYWMVRRPTMTDKPPYLLYSFDDKETARMALLNLSYIHCASDTGNLICDYLMEYGYYDVMSETDDTVTCEAVVCGHDLTMALFIETRESFERMGGVLQSQQIPDENRKKMDGNVDIDAVMFKEDFIDNGKYTYHVYSAPNRITAVEFLRRRPVDEEYVYYMVETPEGSIGRDIDGMYEA